MVNRMKYIKNISLAVLLIVFGSVCSYVINEPPKEVKPEVIQKDTNEETPKEEKFWSSQSATDFITERPRDPFEGMITDEDRDWIDVDGLRNIENGNAALITDSNRNWIGKEVVAQQGTVIPSGQWEAYQKEMAEKSEKWEKERVERVLSSDYISSIDDEWARLPKTVNPFTTEEKNGEYLTPEVIFGGHAMIIYTKPDGSGWNLKKGQSIEFEAEQYELEREKAPKGGQKLIFGYIFDGRYYNSMEDSDLIHYYRRVADKDGEYFITIMSVSSMITLKNGCIKVRDVE